MKQAMFNGEIEKGKEVEAQLLGMKNISKYTTIMMN